MAELNRSEVDFPIFLLEKIVASQFESFLKNLNGNYNDENRKNVKFRTSGSRTKKLINFLSDTEKVSNSKDRKKLFNEFKDFLINQIKYNSTRIVITIPLNILRNSTILKVDSLENFTGKSISQMTFNKVLDQKGKKKDFTKFYQNVECLENEVLAIKSCFLRKVEYSVYNETDNRNGNTIEKKVQKHEYVWTEILPKEKKLLINISNNKKNMFNNNFSGKPHEIYTYFLKILKQEFNIVETMYSEKETLFNIYKQLTEEAEKPYTEKIAPYNDDIDNFIKDMREKLNIKEGEKNDVNLELRIKKTFERALIQRKFLEFRNNENNMEGRVLKFSFSDISGGKVDASGDEEVSLDKCDVYFDTKETIHESQCLKSVTVEWFKLESVLGLSGVEEKIRKIEVRYSAFDEYYITHFMNDNVTEDVSEFVLPKFDKFKG